MTPIVVYLSIVGLLLAIPVGLAITTLLHLEERVIVPLLRTRTGGPVNQAITYKRIQVTRQVETHVQGYAVANPAKLIQPRRIA
jgi:hypothetical protein